jgi:hypothetical protein
VRTEDVGNIHVHFRVLQQRVQHTSAYGQHTPAYASIRQHTPAYARHTPAYASIRQHTLQVCAQTCKRECTTSIKPHSAALIRSVHQHTSAYVSIRQHTSACVSRPVRGSVGPLSSPTQQLSSGACNPSSHGTTVLRPTLPKAQRFDRAPAARPFRALVPRRSPE